MSEFRRQHPVAAITRAIDLVRGNLLTILLVLIFGASGGGGNTFIWIFVGLFVFLLVAGTAGWFRYLYRVEEGELQIQYGILVRKNLYLTRDRVQVIDVTAGIIQRLFGLVSVEIKTAGTTSSEASISAVTQEEAEEITWLLRGNGAEHAQDVRADQEKRDETRKLPVRDLLIAASTSGSFGIALSIIATVFSQIEPLLDETAIYEWLMAVLPADAGLMFVLTLLFIFAIFAWLMSFFGTLIRYGDFRLTIREEEMVIQRGIFEKKRITVPFNRIQAVRVVEGVMRQPFGFVSIHVESAGYGDEQGSGSVVLFPLMRSGQASTFLKQYLPDYCCELPAIRPAKRSITRYMIRSTVVLALVLTGIWWLIDGPNWIWFFLFPGLAWGWLRYRDAAVAIDGERLILRSRLLARTTAIVRRNRAQDLTTSSSWIQRIRDLSNLEVSVASGDQGRSFQILELDINDAGRLLPWISREFDPVQLELTGPGSSGESRLPGWSDR